MERLRGRDDVRVRVRERDHLGVPEDGLCPWSCGRKELEHLRERLDRGHAMPELDEDACQLSRPRSEVDDVERLVADEPADGFVRVAGPAALVRVGDLREGRRRPATLFIAVHDHA